MKWILATLHDGVKHGRGLYPILDTDKEADEIMQRIEVLIEEKSHEMNDDGSIEDDHTAPFDVPHDTSGITDDPEPCSASDAHSEDAIQPHCSFQVLQKQIVPERSALLVEAHRKENPTKRGKRDLNGAVIYGKPNDSTRQVSVEKPADKRHTASAGNALKGAQFSSTLESVTKKQVVDNNVQCITSVKDMIEATAPGTYRLRGHVTYLDELRVFLIVFILCEKCDTVRLWSPTVELDCSSGKIRCKCGTAVSQEYRLQVRFTDQTAHIYLHLQGEVAAMLFPGIPARAAVKTDVSRVRDILEKLSQRPKSPVDPQNLVEITCETSDSTSETDAMDCFISSVRMLHD